MHGSITADSGTRKGFAGMPRMARGAGTGVSRDEQGRHMGGNGGPPASEVQDAA
jgi:hypothetical protein